MVNPYVAQLRFARSEFVRCLEGISDEDARKRLLPMNAISWMVGHMASQEQFYFIYYPQGKILYPDLIELVGFGKPGTTPPLSEMWDLWKEITKTADEFLDNVTEDQLSTFLEQEIKGYEHTAFGTVTAEMLAQKTIKSPENIGTRMLRATFHYFFHTGEAHAVRQQLGHPDLPYFVGGMPDYLFLGKEEYEK